MVSTSLSAVTAAAAQKWPVPFEQHGGLSIAAPSSPHGGATTSSDTMRSIGSAAALYILHSLLLALVIIDDKKTPPHNIGTHRHKQVGTRGGGSAI